MTRRSSALLAALLLLTAPAFAQTSTRVTNDSVAITMLPLTATGNSPWYNITPYGITRHVLTYVISGSPSVVSAALQCSVNGSTASSTIGTGTDTSGATVTGSAICTHIRLALTMTGTGRVYPAYIGITQAGESDADAIQASLDTVIAHLAAIEAAAENDAPVSTLPCQHDEMVRGLGSATAAATDTAVTGTISGDAGLKTYIHSVQVFNIGPTNDVLVALKDGNAGATLGHAIAAKAYGGSVVEFKVPLVTTANTALYFSLNQASTTVYVNAQGCIAP